MDPLLLDPLDTLEPETLFKETLEPTNLFLDTLDTLKAKPRSWYPCYHGNKTQEGESEFLLFDPRKVSTAARSHRHTNVQLYLPT